jgi:hypothetical protein
MLVIQMEETERDATTLRRCGGNRSFRVPNVDCLHCTPHPFGSRLTAVTIPSTTTASACARYPPSGKYPYMRANVRFPPRWPHLPARPPFSPSPC